MYRKEFINKHKKQVKDWRKKHQAEISAAEKEARYTEDGILLQTLYTPSDVGGDVLEAVGLPGDFPFTRGLEATGYRKNIWTLSQYAGFGNPKETNILFKNMI